MNNVNLFVCDCLYVCGKLIVDCITFSHPHSHSHSTSSIIATRCSTLRGFGTHLQIGRNIESNFLFSPLGNLGAPSLSRIKEVTRREEGRRQR